MDTESVTLKGDPARDAVAACFARALEAVEPCSPAARLLLVAVQQEAEPLGLVWSRHFPEQADRLTLRQFTRPRLNALVAALRQACLLDESGLLRQEAELAELFGLDEISQRILGVYLLQGLSRGLEQLLLESGRRHSSFSTDAVVALLTALPQPLVRRHLTRSSPLSAAGLLVMDEDEIELLPRVRRLLHAPPGTELFDLLIGPSKAPELAWRDFRHLGESMETLAAVLKGALRAGEPGMHVLLYGPPGTGKTEFARALAARVGAPLHAVGEADEDGDEPARVERLGELRLAQKLAAGRRALLMVDEAEDLFVADHGWKIRQSSAGSRVFMHRLLEEAPVPTIWIVNYPDVLDAAVRRRMAFCLEMKIPPHSVRVRLWSRLARQEGVKLSGTEAARLARVLPVPPALTRSALRAARLAGGDAKHVQSALAGTAAALFGATPEEPESEADDYDLDLINANADLRALTDRLSAPGATRQVSLLLSGPPGCGKSAFARHLAQRLEMESLTARASDLLDMWVGSTEKAIAALFRRAREERAFLIIDEADGLLADRREAVRSWEISQVNELLIWMERHPLPFVFTTNLAERLDPASARRFLIKARFDWLTPLQVRLAFRRFFGLEPPADALASLEGLTPADFALVRRKAELLGSVREVTTLCDLLRCEAQAKNGLRRVVGFVAGDTF